jgi:hypothetical protein
MTEIGKEAWREGKRNGCDFTSKFRGKLKEQLFEKNSLLERNYSTGTVIYAKMDQIMV